MIKLAEIIRSANPDERDVWKNLLDLKGVVEEAVDGVKAGRDQQLTEASGHIAQLGLDLWTSWAERTNPALGKILNTVNIAQQGGWEVARMIQNRVEASNFDRTTQKDSEILSTLIRKEREYLNKRTSRNVDPAVTPTHGTARSTRDLDLDDDALRRLDWIEHGHRKFTSAELEEFYARNPDLQPFRSIAELRSPETEYYEWLRKQHEDEQRLQELRRRAARADADLVEAQRQLNGHRSPALGGNRALPRNYICRTGPCTLNEWIDQPRSFPSRQTYVCETGPCTLAEWQAMLTRLATPRNRADSESRSPDQSAQTWAVDSGKSPAGRTQPLRNATQTARGTLGFTDAANANPDPQKWCVNPAAGAELQRFNSAVRSARSPDDLHAVGTLGKNPDGSWIPIYIPCSASTNKK